MTTFYGEVVAYQWVQQPGQELRKWRKEHDLTLHEVSLLLGTSIANVSDIERGIHDMSLSTLRKCLEWVNSTDEQIQYKIRCARALRPNAGN